MVAGHQREQNGYYQMVLNWKRKDGKRKSKSIYTHLDYSNKVSSASLLLTQFAGMPYTNQGIDNKCPGVQNYGIKSKKEKTQSRFP